MEFICDTEKYYNSISNSEDKKKFKEKYLKGKSFKIFPYIKTRLFDSKTVSQNSAIWRDMSIVAKLMYTDKETVYYWLLKASVLKDIWLQESCYGNGKKKTFKFRTLSKLTKEEMMEAIPRFRDYMQQLVNEEYGEYVVIHWSKIDNIGKPDYEL